MSRNASPLHPDSKAIVLCTVDDIHRMIDWINQQPEDEYLKWTARERELFVFRNALWSRCRVCGTSWPAEGWRFRYVDGQPQIQHRCSATNDEFRVMAHHELEWT